MTRHARMTGRPALFLPGLDHASIAAQFVLDRILAAEGESRASLGREAYLARMREFVERTREVIVGQQRRVGASLDWSRLRFTMDEVSARAVREAFSRLYEEGLAYRTEALVNWCPGCRTSVSDLEVVPTPETGTLWFVRYHLVDEATGEPDPAATITRRHDPTGDDPRRHRRRGPSRRRPLLGPRRPPRPHPVRRARRAPSSPTPAVDPAFGTGAVKITPAHDHDDYDMGRRHDLPLVTILDDEARMTADSGPYAGLDRFEARRADRGRPRRARGPRRGAPPRDGHRPLPAQQRHRRAAPQDAVVHPDDAPRRGRPRGDPQRADPDPARAIREGLGALADRHPRLEREPPAVVGPSHPGLVLPRRPRDGERRGGRSGRLRCVRPSGRRAHPGPRHLRHLVQLRACGRSRRSAGPGRPTISAATTPDR